MSRQDLGKPNLIEVGKQVRPSDFLDYRLYLVTIYQRLKAQHQGFSYRSYGELMGFGFGTLLHQICQGYRPLTQKSGARVIKAMELDGMQKNYFTTLITYCNAKKTKDHEAALATLMELKRQLSPSVLDRDMLAYFSQWYHPAIRELVVLDDFNNDPEWIANYLSPKITPAQAKESMELLERIGYISYDHETKKFAQSNPRINSGHEVEGLGLINYHHKMLDLAKDSLSHSNRDERDYGAVTIAIDADLIPKLKDLIHRFQVEVVDLADRQEDPKGIYQLNLQLFPLSELGSKQGDDS